MNIFLIPFVNGCVPLNNKYNGKTLWSLKYYRISLASGYMPMGRS